MTWKYGLNEARTRPRSSFNDALISQLSRRAESKRRTKAENVREVAGLCADMASTVSQGGREVYWITPPKAHPERYPEALQEEMAQLMKASVSPYGHVYDSRKVTTFVDGLNLPRMILPLGDRIAVRETDTMDVVAYRDTDGDGVADERTLLYERGPHGRLSHGGQDRPFRVPRTRDGGIGYRQVVSD